MAHARCMLDKTTHVQHTPALVHPHQHIHIHTPTRTPAHTHTHTFTYKYMTLIAFPRQQWFCEHASVLHYTYIASVVLVLDSLLQVN